MSHVFVPSSVNGPGLSARTSVMSAACERIHPGEATGAWTGAAQRSARNLDTRSGLKRLGSCQHGPVAAAPDRLSALDAAFLDLETARAPLHVGWTLVFDGAPPSLAALRRHVDSRLAGIPRFRRRVVQPGARARRRSLDR